MKTIKNTLYLAVICLTLVFTGCSSNDDDGGAADGGTAAGGGAGNLTATVAGQSYDSDSDFTNIQIITQNGITVLAIMGARSAETIQFNIVGYSDAGTYDLGLVNIGTYAKTLDINDPVNSTVTYISNMGGELVITEDTGSNMKGTFFFTATNIMDPSDSKTIESGTFNIPY
jgi:hypothetical protein